jgi:hypothetical protein
MYEYTENEVIAQIEILKQLEYINIYSGTLENPKMMSCVEYSEVIKKLNERRKELALMRRKLTKYEKMLLDYVSDMTNRSLGQTLFLFELCEYDFNKLCQLEEKLKNTFASYCPGDKKSVEDTLKLDDRTDYWSFENNKKNVRNYKK